MSFYVGLSPSLRTPAMQMQMYSNLMEKGDREPISYGEASYWASLLSAGKISHEAMHIGIQNYHPLSFALGKLNPTEAADDICLHADMDENAMEGLRYILLGGIASELENPQNLQLDEVQSFAALKTLEAKALMDKIGQPNPLLMFRDAIGGIFKTNKYRACHFSSQAMHQGLQKPDYSCSNY